MAWTEIEGHNAFVPYLPTVRFFGVLGCGAARAYVDTRAGDRRFGSGSASWATASHPTTRGTAREPSVPGIKGVRKDFPDVPHVTVFDACGRPGGVAFRVIAAGDRQRAAVQ